MQNFWHAFRGLRRIVKGGGFVVLTVPFIYPFHLSPADFWRYTHLAIWHMLESVGFAVCKLASDGIRAAQMTTLGFTFREIPERFVREAPWRLA